MHSQSPQKVVLKEYLNAATDYYVKKETSFPWYVSKMFSY